MIKALHQLWSRLFKRSTPRWDGQRTESVSQIGHEVSGFEDLEAINPTGQVVPYDEHLLERSRTQWQFGDWASLAALEQTTLQYHPDRARLALLAASGHCGCGNTVEARLYTRLAQDWGCPKKLITQVLISGVDNTIARAAAASEQLELAHVHFEKAIAVGMPGSDARLLVQARACQQLSQLGLAVPEGPQSADAGGTAMPKWKLPPLAQNIEALADTLKQQKAEIDAQFKKQSDSLVDFRKRIEGSLKKELLNATQQLEAYLDVQSFFNDGEHLPSMHGWPISPDFARYLIQLIEKNNYDLVLEFGSGTSTVLIAKALAKLQHVRQDKPAVMQVAFEHLEKYYAKTLEELESVRLAHSVMLNLTPLQPYIAPNGQTYHYYDCHQSLADLAANLPTSLFKILVVVDGPPGSTGKHARYPCLPAVLTHFKHKHIDVLLDDYARSDEKEVGVLWEQDLSQTGYRFFSEKISMEKEALFITAKPE